MKKKVRDFLKKNKSNIIFLAILLLFISLLTSVPSLVNNAKTKSETVYFNEDAIDPYEKEKFEYISKTVLDDITNLKINSINMNYVNYLIYEDKIINRDHTIGQEIVAQYVNGNINISKNLAREFVEMSMNKVESKKERIWRNHRLSFEHRGKEEILYEDTKLLVTPIESKYVAIGSKIITPYKFQIYTFTFDDGTQENVTLNLLTNEGEEQLSNYIDFETDTPKMNFTSIESKFVNSNDRFELKFIIWR